MEKAAGCPRPSSSPITESLLTGYRTLTTDDFPVEVYYAPKHGILARDGPNRPSS